MYLSKEKHSDVLLEMKELLNINDFSTKRSIVQQRVAAATFFFRELCLTIKKENHTNKR